MKFVHRLLELGNGGFHIRSDGGRSLLQPVGRFFQGCDRGLNLGHQKINILANFANHVTDVVTLARAESDLLHNRVEKTRFSTHNHLPCHKFHVRSARVDDIHHGLSCERRLDGNLHILLEFDGQTFGDGQSDSGSERAVDIDQIHALDPPAGQAGDLNCGTDAHALSIFKDDVDGAPVG